MLKKQRPKNPKRPAKNKAPKAASARKKTKETGKPELKVLNASGKTIETIPVDDIIAGSDTSSHLLHQAAVMAHANRRLGTAKTKTRAEVSGGGRKPWRQKGTGRARAGSNRSPLWRGGGTTFGPQPRDFAYQLPKRMKRLALIAGLKVKASEGKLFIIEEFAAVNGKTKSIAQLTGKLCLKKPVVIIEAHDPAVVKSVRNIKRLVLTTSDQVAPYDVLASDECVMTRKGYSRLLERLKAAV